MDRHTCKLQLGWLMEASNHEEAVLVFCKAGNKTKQKKNQNFQEDKKKKNIQQQQKKQNRKLQNMTHERNSKTWTKKTEPRQ